MIAENVEGMGFADP